MHHTKYCCTAKKLLSLKHIIVQFVITLILEGYDYYQQVLSMCCICVLKICGPARALYSAFNIDDHFHLFPEVTVVRWVHFLTNSLQEVNYG